MSNMSIGRHSFESRILLCVFLATVLGCFVMGCEITPTTRASLCVRNHETQAPIAHAEVSLSEQIMFKPGRARDNGVTDSSGCVILKAGLLDRMRVQIETAEGAYYSSSLSHPRVHLDRSSVTLPAQYPPNGPPLDIVLTEIKER